MILISSLTPDIPSAGSIILQRHLVDNPEIDLQVIKTEPKKWTLRGILRRILGRVGRTKLSSFSQDAMVLWHGGWIDGELPAPEAVEIPSVVMTVAHHEACYAAMRYAKRYQLPLVTIFHDWWPDIPSVHEPFKSMLERSFRELYKASSLALCVSPRMKEVLGPHGNAKVLLPIPGVDRADKNCLDTGAPAPFRLLYAGNLREYGSMLMEALEVFKDHPDIRLEVRGNSASWPESIKKEMGERGLLLPYASRAELNAWLGTADAFLVTQTFEEKDLRLMQTNFPSKLTEFAKFEKPLVLWGPEYASGPKWVRETGLGLVVDKESPEFLKQALEQLCKNKEEQERLSRAAADAAAGCFSPERIQAEFIKHLKELDYERCADASSPRANNLKPNKSDEVSRKPFGLVTACHAGDKYMVGATLASMRHYCPDVPICLIADGDVDVSDLEKQYDLTVLRIDALPSKEMREMIGASYRVKLAAMWEGPFEHYVWLDSDAILWGDIRKYVRKDLDFQIFWPEISIPADAEEEPPWLAHFYFNLSELKKLDPAFEWRGHPYFSAGAFACRRNAISYEEWVKMEQWGKKIPNLFEFQDQGILNYLVFSKSQRGKMKVDWTDLQWSRSFDHYHLDEDCESSGWSFPEETSKATVLHFCGRKPSTLDLNCYSRPFTIARLEHHRMKHSKLVAWGQVLREDAVFLTPKVWGKIKRGFGAD